MKVLHLCYSDLDGGAARAAYRLHKAQRDASIDSHMLVINKLSDDETVHTVSGFSKLRITLAGVVSRKILTLQKSTNTIHHSMNIFSSGIVKIINQINPDVVNLHWLGFEMLSIKNIATISQPIVWTMHDMWAFCGAEHYENIDFSDRYLNDYTKRNRPPKYSGIDIDKYIFKIKKKHWANKKINFVCPSQWLANCVKRSQLFSGQSVSVISNCINHSIYKPLDKDLCRSLLGLPLNKRLILFGAMSSTSDPRKGYHLLKESMAILHNDKITSDIEAVVFGASKGDAEELTGMKTHYMGRIYDDVTLALLYNAADIFVGPSLQDNLPNTYVEAIACGTPCVGFNIGGIKDLISSPFFGELCKEVSSSSLALSIKAALKNSIDAKDIAEKSNEIRAESKVANEYKNLYKNIMSQLS